jgi:hypothetical protein
VRDVDHRAALGAQPGDDVEQPRGLARGQRGRGLVEDDEVVAVAALWGDFYVGGSTLTVNGQRRSVPEPGTLALFGAALLGFGLLRRKPQAN